MHYKKNILLFTTASEEDVRGNMKKIGKIGLLALGMLAMTEMTNNQTINSAAACLDTIAVAQQERKPLEELIANASKELVLEKAYLASNDKNGFATTENKIMHYAKDIVLYPVIEASWNGMRIYLCETDSIMLNGKQLDPDSILRIPESTGITYYKVEPKRQGYQETCIGEGPALQTDVAPTTKDTLFAEPAIDPAIINAVNPEERIPVGTMRYAIKVVQGEKKVWTPGKSAMSYNPKSVHRISNAGNTGFPVVDMAYTMGNVPYLYGSSDVQSKEFIASDCADFCITAYNLAGHAFSYTSTEYLTDEFSLVEKCVLRRDLAYVPVSKPLFPGDILDIKGMHAGILVRDNEPVGLDLNDLVLHTSADNHQPRVENVRAAFNMHLRNRIKMYVLRPEQQSAYDQFTHAGR
ncbi:MAG: hypothetical protein V1725_07100 [archaeon]